MPRAYIVFLETFLGDVGGHSQLASYRQQVAQTMAPYEGQFVVRGGHFSVIEGEWPYERCVVIEFPCRQKAEAWYWSPEYRSLLPLRLSALQANAIIIDGVD